MKKFYIVIFMLLSFKNYTISQNISRLWANFRIDSTAGFFHFSDMATDANGNSYLAGYESYTGAEYYQTHFVLLKVNASGAFEWKKNFNNLRDSIDEAIAVTTDAAGYVYVTGKRIDTFCNICTYSTKVSDIITMKYDGAGNRIWLNRYHDANYILAEPSSISQGPNGSILITGNETQYNEQIGDKVSKLLMQKINKSGQTVWVRKYKNVVGHSGCFDKAGNIVVAGASDSANIYQLQKPMLLKFSAGGVLTWSNVFNERNKNGSLYFVACDSLNNIYTNGQTDTLAFYNNPRIITLKYNPDGQRLWYKKETNHTTTAPRYYGDFKIDGTGNAYLTGFVEKSSVDDDWLTVKYGPNGGKKWSKTFDDPYHGSDKPIGIALDSKSNVFVAGYIFSGNGNYSMATVGYNKNGDSIFSDVYKKTKANGFAAGIGVDKNDNIYTGGSFGFYNNPHPASVVIKYGIKKPSPFTENQIAKTVNDLKLYPNPVSNNLNVLFSSGLLIKDYNLTIHDINGNLVLAKQIGNTNMNAVNLNVDVSSLKRGVYTATITDGFNTVSKTFIKE